VADDLLEIILRNAMLGDMLDVFGPDEIQVCHDDLF